MKFVNYISTISIPFIIFIIVFCGIREKKNVYDIFTSGVQDGIKIIINLFPTLLAIFLSINMLRSSGIIDEFTRLISFFTIYIKFPSEIIPLALLRPISGSASLAIATDIMKIHGVDSKVGLIASTIMGSTETTFYTIAIYTSSIKVKKMRFVLIPALIADFVGIVTSVIIWNIL